MPVLENQHHERFCCGIASGKSNADAYTAAGYSPKGAGPSAARLLRKANVRERIAELKTQVAEQVVLRAGIDKNSRLARYQARLSALDKIITARAEDPSMGVAPGGSTGWMTRTEKIIGGGDNALKVEEFTDNTPLLREMRELEKQIAIEMGEWVERGRGDAASVQVNVAVRQDLIALGPEFAQEYLALCEKHGGNGSTSPGNT